MTPTETAAPAIPPTGNDRLDAILAMVLGGIVSCLYVLKWVQASGLIETAKGLKDTLFNTAKAVETATNGETEAVLREFFPGFDSQYIQEAANRIHKLVTGRIQKVNKAGGTEKIMKPIVTAAKIEVEEIRKSQAAIPIPKETKEGGRVRIVLLVIVALLLGLGSWALSGCAAVSIPDHHIAADEAFLQSAEEEFLDLARQPGATLEGVTVTPEIIDERLAKFRVFRKTLDKIKAQRAGKE